MPLPVSLHLDLKEELEILENEQEIFPAHAKLLAQDDPVKLRQ